MSQAETRVLYLMNQLKDNLVEAIDSVAEALGDDGRIDAFEALGLTTQFTSAVLQSYGLVSRLDGESLEAFISVLHNLEFVVAPSPEDDDDDPF